MMFRQAADQWIGRSTASCCEQVQYYTRKMFADWVYPLLGEQRIDAIQPQQIARLLLAYEQHAPSKARRMLRLFEQIYGYAKAMGWCCYSPAEGLAVILKPVQCKGFAFVDARQMPSFLAACHTHALRAADLAVFWLLVYTAVRRAEAVKAAVAEFDLAAATWTIPPERMKMRRPHVVPLAPPVVAMLADWLAVREAEGINGQAMFGIPVHRPNEVIRQAGWSGRMTIHGLRKVFSTAAHESGHWHADAIELQLAHLIPGVRGVYNKAAMLDERRQLMVWYADQVDDWCRLGGIGQ